MRLVFWISLAVIGYTYVGYPLVMFMLARLRPRPWRREPMQMSVSVIMAVHNGAHLLREKIDQLLALDAKYVREILIVSDGSSDGTVQILAETSEPRLRPIVLEEQGGKAAALNSAIAASTSDVLLFIDLRQKIAEGALEELMSNFADPTVGCVAGELLIDSAGHDAAAAAVSGVYWRYEKWIRDCEAAWDSPVGVSGCFYAVRRNLATVFPAGIILDDMFQPLAIVRQGYRSVLDRAAFVTDSGPGQVQGEFQRKVRTLAGNYQLIAVAPWVLSPRNRVLFQLISHKLLRLVVPYFFLAMLLSSTSLGVGSGGWRLLAAAQWIFWLFGLAGVRGHVPVVHRYAAAIGALLLLNVAAVAGLYRFLFTSGPLWRTWSVPAAANNCAALNDTGASVRGARIL